MVDYLTRSAIFDAGKTSRISAGHFMAELITDDLTWKRWKGQVPVIYNLSWPAGCPLSDPSR